MAETKFSAEQMEQFIDIYRSFDCLWDVKCKEYRDINKRNNAYEAMADIINITIEQVKKKLNNIRSTYLQEKKKVDISKSTGSGTEDIYTPNLSWFGSMTFLDDVTTQRKTNSTPSVVKCVSS
ncbi:uncharacterized protein LOC130450245 [Diorhabda sublineata]|uniref:uncharacterized protein LOC130450245 n=1 Tax=Diorhabda sublineata TaxID=1163346 RepID=UPI0024E0F73E|nr:uncharacterized protein LOC130450245 [Diorhabda sublineata]